MFLRIVFLHHVSCVPNNVTVSGLSFVIDPSVFSNDYLLEVVFAIINEQFRETVTKDEDKRSKDTP
jgi:hypothetical protein